MGTFLGEKDVSFMFLSEAALGTPNEIKVGACHLKSAPKGFDSVVARGTREPGS